MELNLLISLVAKLENAEDRRLVIRNGWSDEEAVERRRIAMESQLELAAILSMEQSNSVRLVPQFEMAS